MDSDTPRFKEIVALCKEFEALLFVDVAHDLGAQGRQGRGQLEVQQCLAEVDVLMGSFSKSFAANGGFVATRSRRLFEYLRMYGNSYMFSNAMAPLQAAVVNTCLMLVRSPEGEERRRRVHDVAKALRTTFQERGIFCYGDASPIIPVAIGTESKSRLVFREVQRRGVAAAVIEFPIVPRGLARFRLQAMATHSLEDARVAAHRIADTIDEVDRMAVATTGN